MPSIGYGKPYIIESIEEKKDLNIGYSPVFSMALKYKSTVESKWGLLLSIQHFEARVKGIFLYFLEFSFILITKEVHMSNQLLNKYAEVISSLKASNGIKVVSVEEIQDNEVFLRLKDSFESYFET